MDTETKRRLEFLKQKKKNESALQQTNNLVTQLVEGFAQKNENFEIIPQNGQEEAHVIDWLEKNFPFAPGKISWKKVKNYKCVTWSSWGDLLHHFEKILHEISDNPGEEYAYALFSNALRPIVKVKFSTILKCSEEILNEDSDVWIVSPTNGWCIEKYHEGTLCLGFSK
jgi:hypothetical protein